MILFFRKSSDEYYVVSSSKNLLPEHESRLVWIFSGATLFTEGKLSGKFVGPRKEMITPWSTNAVEIAQNAGIDYLDRIEILTGWDDGSFYDPMLQGVYENPGQDIFEIERNKESISRVSDISAYNQAEGLALSSEEVHFLENVCKEIGRELTDSEVFGFSQINSEHCRHKIFNGRFTIDGEAQAHSLFQWIKQTAAKNPNLIVSAYKDNVAFIQGPVIEQFAPRRQDMPDFFQVKDVEAVISLKAETHNFPTTVEPFNGAATGSGGEIRDRLAGGQGSTPLAGTAVYMTSYPRTEKGRFFESHSESRPWLYQSPEEILIKASNGASDFGNKYGQPLIAGSVLTFEYQSQQETLGYDKVIMLAGGIGFGKKEDSQKKPVSPDQEIVVLGGDNYRIGMGGGAVSSVNTGEFDNAIELNAVQRSNPEMQKRVANTIRAMTELDENPIVSIHDHGAGGHLNCLSELVEDTGGTIETDKLPKGDPTLSDKEVLSNESQERMGLVIKKQDYDYLEKVALRERAPIYHVGHTANNDHLLFQGNGEDPFSLDLNHLFGASPTLELTDKTAPRMFADFEYQIKNIQEYLSHLLQLEAVASKDWLTNKVDRCVSGKVAIQQTVGEIQLPMNNMGVMSFDYKNVTGVATSIGHSPVPALIDAGAGSRLSVAEALTNLVFAPLSHGLKGVSLSANWMWPAKNPGENARLYQAVKEISEFVQSLGINIPTGKDSLSMTQNYHKEGPVQAPGTVIISSVAEVADIRKVVTPVIDPQNKTSRIVYIPFGNTHFELGGSSLAQVLGAVGKETPDTDAETVKNAFQAIQEMIEREEVIAGHDISAGGMITTLLEMNFPNTRGGMRIDLSGFGVEPMKVLFSEQPGVILQITNSADLASVQKKKLNVQVIGSVTEKRALDIKQNSWSETFDIDHLRDIWMKSSHLLDLKQTEVSLAKKRFLEYKSQPLQYKFPEGFSGKYAAHNLDPNRKTPSGVKAAIIREKGVNGDREMAYALHLAGFDVKDVHMTDLVSGRENLADVGMIAFVGGFSNSDVLGSAKGWAASFLFNPRAKKSLEDFYAREDTLSLGVCNGCQLMTELEVIYPEIENHPKMLHNSTGKFESAFINVEIQPNNSIMFGNMAGSKLGIWLAHGEGQFALKETEGQYQIPVKYVYDFPGNPNGSDFNCAALSSKDGRHIAIMPHLERTLFPWNWAHYEDKTAHDVSPWMIPFINAFEWLKDRSL